MRPLRLLPALLLVLAIPACAKEPPPAASADPTEQAEAAALQPKATPPVAPKRATANAIKPLDKKQFGAPITESKTTALTDLLKEPSKFGGQTVRTEGIVSAVCQSMGCWMEIADDAGSAHIKMAGHSFFVPREASGHRAVIQGKILSSPEEGGSCAEKDGCREQAEQQTGRIAKVEMEATGVEFVD